MIKKLIRQREPWSREAEAVALIEQSPAGAGFTQLSTAKSARRAWLFQPDGFQLRAPLGTRLLQRHFGQQQGAVAGF
jgi:hypothetical protein